MKRKVIYSITAVIIIGVVVCASIIVDNKLKDKKNVVLKKNVVVTNQATEAKNSDNSKITKINSEIMNNQFTEAKDDIATITDKSESTNLNAKLANYEQSDATFNGIVKQAFSLMDKNNSITEFKNVLNNINTNNLTTKDSQKLEMLKNSIPELSKICNCENLLQNGNYSEAKQVFSTINQSQLINNNIMTQQVFDSMLNSINKGLSEKSTQAEGVTAGFIRNIVSEITGTPVLILTPTEEQSYKNLRATNPNYFNEIPKAYSDKTLATFGNVTITTPNNASAGQPNVIINGQKAYIVNIQESDRGLGGGLGFSIAVIGVNGHVYTHDELCNAVENGTLYGLSNLSGNFQQITVQEARQNYATGSNVLVGGGNCNGLISLPNNENQDSATSASQNNFSNIV